MSRECFLSIFFFKQKTAYEMRISDWSSDVCSSDLGLASSTQLRRRQTTERQSAGLMEPTQPTVLRIADRFACLPGGGESDRLDVRDVARMRVRRGPVQRGGFDIPRLLEHDLELEVPVLDPGELPGVARSEERRVGKECVSTCRSVWSP